MSGVAEYTGVQPVYMNDVYIPLLSDENRYLVLRGGGGSGKSVWAAQKVAIRLTSEHNHRLLIVRKVKDTLRQSVYEQILDVLRGWGLMGRITATTSPLAIRCADTNSEILFVGIDDPEKIKSITRITSIWIEEATELTLPDFTQLDIRLRGKANYYKQFIITFNPVSETHWLKKRFFDVEEPRATTLLTTFQDNYFLPEEDRQTLLSLAATNQNYHRIYVLNEWGRLETGNEWYYQFKRGVHVRPTPYLPGENIFQSWDANADPYSGMLCFQLESLPNARYLVRFFREYAIRGAVGGLRATARQYVLDHKAMFSRSSVLYTGDASMRNRRPGSPQESPMKDVEAEMLPVSNGASNIWLKQNPSVLGRRDWANSLLAGEDPSIEIQIDPSLTELIDDLEQTQKGIGEKLKQLFRDTEKGVTYQIRGHMGDCWDYALASRFPDKLQAFLRRGASK